MTALRFILALLVVLLAGRAVVAQDAVVVSGARPECSTCKLVLERISVLRMPETEAALVSPFNFARDSRSNVYFADPFGEIGVRVFDRAGRFLRTVGRRGQGPGEFSVIHGLAIGPGDSLHVFHAGHSVFSPKGTHVRTQSFLNGRQVTSVATLSNGGFVVTTRASSANPNELHVVDSNGTVSASFGRSAGSGFWAGMRSLSNPIGGAFWTARANSYELEQYSLQGKRLKVLRRDVEWFAPWQDWNGEPEVSAPPPRIMSVAQDSASGLLWVLILTADRNWKPASSSNSGEKALSTTRDLAGLFDGIVEVVDPDRGTVVASERFSGFLLQLLAAGTVVELSDQDGATVVNIWQVQLRRQSDQK